MVTNGDTPLSGGRPPRAEHGADGGHATPSRRSAAHESLRSLALIAAIAAGLLILVSLASTSSLGTLGESLPHTPRPMPTAVESPQTPPSGTPSPPFQMPEQQGEPWRPPAWLNQLVPFLIVAGALTALAILVRLVVRALRHRKPVKRADTIRTRGVTLSDEGADDVVASLDEGLSALRSGVGVDDAILECWRRLETIAADSGIVRQSHQTATEFVTDLLAGTSAPRTSLEELARLYRAAMFSPHERPEADRERAIGCLEELRDAIRAGLPSRPADIAPESAEQAPSEGRP